MSNLNNLWKSKEVVARELLLDNSIDELENIIKNAYIKVSTKLMNEMLEMYATILEEEDKPLASHLYRYNRYYELINNIQMKLTELGVKEQRVFEDRLVKLYEENQKIVGKSFNLSSNINHEQAKAAVNEVWVNDGKRFSDRIWTDKAALTEKLQTSLVEGISAGKSVDRLAEDFMSDFNVSYNNAKRLVRTEMAHCHIQSTIDKYKEAGVTKYRLLSEPDCCDECNDLKNNVYSIEDTEHLPPEHPNCRCSILAVIE